MASPPEGSRSYSPASPSYRQRLLDSLRPIPTPTPTSPPPPAPSSPSSPGSPMSILEAPWWSPWWSPSSSIYSPSSALYSPTTSLYSYSPASSTADSPPPPSPVYRAVLSPTSPNYCPEEFNYCYTQTSPIHGNCSTEPYSPTMPAYCPGEFNDHASPALLGSPAYSPMSPGFSLGEFSPMSPGFCTEGFNGVWEDIALADKVQTPASPEYCYCCSTTLKDCCCYQHRDDAPAP